jgi:hypothetical protein
MPAVLATPVEQLWQQIKQRFLSNTTFQHYDDIIEVLATGSISPSALSLAGHTAPKIYPYSNCC